MNTSYVNGLKLPDQLVTMLASGRWNPPEDREVLAKLGIEDSADLAFLGLAAMEENTNALKQLSDKQGELFGLVSGCGKSIVEGQLDITKAVMIAATRGQEALCLDYSTAGTPRIVASRYEPEGVKWVEVARSFDDLLEILKLSAT
jgi:hypothetical protein